MESIHGEHCNVHYSRPKRCGFCGKRIIWYSCDHLSVAGLPLDSRDPWIEHKCHKFNLHRWKKEVGSTPIGMYITNEMSEDHKQSVEAVMRLNSQLLSKRDQASQFDVNRIAGSITECIRLSEVLLQLPEELRGNDIEVPDAIKNRRRQLLKQHAALSVWRDEILKTR